MAAPPHCRPRSTNIMRVHFVEFRQIRRNDRTIKWLAGETYDYDPDMEPMIKIGHARLVPDPVVPAQAGTQDPGAPPAEEAAPVRRRGRPEPAEPAADSDKIGQT